MKKAIEEIKKTRGLGGIVAKTRILSRRKKGGTKRCKRDPLP